MVGFGNSHFFCSTVTNNNSQFSQNIRFIYANLQRNIMITIHSFVVFFILHTAGWQYRFCHCAQKNSNHRLDRQQNISVEN